MGIVKVIPSKSGATLKGLKASLNYIFRQDKSEEQYRAVTGPFEADKITPTNVYNAFIHEQELWHKTQGRTYAHYVLSWHKDEPITPDMALARNLLKSSSKTIKQQFQFIRIGTTSIVIYSRIV